MANRLARETSPYLLQHAHNPVDWYPWGEEAFRRAREEDRPILLSIGYSACHWCHVMERESFDDPEVAEIMNREFVPVKVDREERPDVDSIYMRAVQALTGHGGWPLTAFLTPGGEPFYGGTYFPPEPRHGMPSFRQLLRATAEAYRSRREDVDRAAGELRDLLERSTGVGRDAERADGDGGLSSSLLDDAADRILGELDPLHGGFGRAPKFPQPAVLEFLLRHHRRSGRRDGLDAVLLTLRRMARGGIHDQLGGGFHRYSVDARWLVPHFEKMLYDNALLAGIYLDAHRVTGDRELGEVAGRTLDYLLEDLRSPEGGFYSARDADSEGEEGLFYVWTPEEVEEVIGDTEEARLFRECLGVTEEGNFEGRSILHLPDEPEALARKQGMSVEQLRDRLRALGDRLLERRARREAPFRDEKILAGWNGLALRSLAEAGIALGRFGYTEAARTGADFLLGALRADDRLRRVWKDGRARIDGFLEDYASLGNALLTLHETTLEGRWLEQAHWCARRVVDLFHDPESGLFFDSAKDAEPLVVRPRDPMDTATPSGQSLAVELLLRLGHLLDDDQLRAPAVRALEWEGEMVGRAPSAFGRLLSVVGLHLDAPLELVVVGERDAPGTRELLSAFHRGYRPERVVTGRAPGDPPPPLPLPLLEGRESREGRPTAYPCRRGTCRAPVTTGAELEEELRALEGHPGDR